MLYVEPKKIIATLRSDNGALYLSLQKNRMSAALAYVLQANGYHSAPREISQILATLEECQIKLSIPEYVRMAAVCPVEAAGVGDGQGTDGRSCLLNLVSYYYLSSSWPTFGDDVDQDAWYAVLNKAIAFFRQNS